MEGSAHGKNLADSPWSYAEAGHPHAAPLGPCWLVGRVLGASVEPSPSSLAGGHFSLESCAEARKAQRFPSRGLTVDPCAPGPQSGLQQAACRGRSRWWSTCAPAS